MNGPLIEIDARYIHRVDRCKEGSRMEGTLDFDSYDLG